MLQVSNRTSTVKNNGFNPIWEETLSLPFHVLGDMRELVFVRFAVREDGDDENEALAVHCVSLACLREGVLSCLLLNAVMRCPPGLRWIKGLIDLTDFSPCFVGLGFRHLPLYDAHVSQYLFSTLFVQIELRDDSS